MEPYVKEQFTKAITICGDKPEYENVKDFMQDMIDYNVAMKSKDTPTHMLKFLHNAAYNQKFSVEFRDCIQNVVFERQIDDQATMFLVRKLRIMCDTREEDIKKKDERIHELESELEKKIDHRATMSELIKDKAEQLRMSEFKSRGQFGPGDQVDEANRMKRIEENEKTIKVCELEQLVDKLEKRVEKLREINDKLLEENYDLREKIGDYEYPSHN